jgi:hypothetical protein
MSISEFQIRAWQLDESKAQVLVHSSPVGDIRKPITVPCDLRRLDEARNLFQSQWFTRPDAQPQLISLGRLLAEVLLPSPVYALLTSSIQILGPDNILRIRLCLDPALIDLPWEYVYRPDMEKTTSLTGFLLFDHRLSLVREAPLNAGMTSLISEKQRMVVTGALWSAQGEKWDRWEVQEEYRKLAESLSPLKDFLSLHFVIAADDIEGALAQPAAIFHYSGHTDSEAGSAYLVREVKAMERGSELVESLDKMYSFELANLLQQAKTRLAVFSACNSGRWTFVEPLLRAGLPVLIGTQGIITTKGAYTFCRSLYAKLAVGLSLDEALTGARFQLMKDGGFNGRESLEWGIFMTYMPVAEAVLFPRAVKKADVAAFQETARQSSQRAVAEVTGRIGDLDNINRSSLRKAIVEKFTMEEEGILCADIKQSLANAEVKIELDLDTLGGPQQGEEGLVQELIDYLDRRGFLGYLVDAVHQARPEIKF